MHHMTKHAHKATLSMTSSMYRPPGLGRNWSRKDEEPKSLFSASPITSDDEAAPVARGARPTSLEENNDPAVRATDSTPRCVDYYGQGGAKTKLPAGRTH
jgi:hypothetical protein